MRNIEEAVLALVNVKSWNDAVRIVRQHSELLLSPKADEFIKLLEMAQSDERAKRVVTECRSLLARCRAVGIEQTLVERSTPTTPLALEGDVAEAQRLETQRQRNPRSLVPLIQIYERILRFQLGEYPAFRAAVQLNLGNAYYDLLQGDREASVMRATEYFREALRFYKPETAPHIYAILQNNLGNAYSSLSTGDRERNLEQAIEFYLEALRFQTPEVVPFDYASVVSHY
jgi:tetratricopeptide (TPR) repeat protein